MGGTVFLVGEVVDSDFIQEIEEGVANGSVNAGKIVGQAADETVGIVGGIIKKDEYAIEEGFEQLCDSVGKTIIGTGNGIKNIVVNMPWGLTPWLL